MIESIDSVTSATPNTTDLAPLIQQIAKRADLNGDGTVSGAEFAQFLVGLLRSLNTSGATTASTGSTATGASAASTFGAMTSANLPPCPPGYDPAKWVDLSHTTPKYVVGRVLAKYPPTPAGLIAAMPELQAAMPGLTQAGDDTLNVPGAGLVDVGLSFGAGGGVGWWWGPVDQA